MLEGMVMLELKTIRIFLLIFTILFSMPNFAVDSHQQTSSEVDLEITRAINKRIQDDKLLSTDKVVINTQDGIVSIVGIVNSNTDAESIIQIASSTERVRDIDTRQLYIIESSQPFADMIITAKIKALLLKEKLFGSEDIPLMGIEVESNNGIVYLSGATLNSQQVNSAIKIAKSVQGVKNVISRINIESKEPK